MGGTNQASLSKTGGWQVQLGTAAQDTVRAVAIGPDGDIYAAGALSQGSFVARLSVTGERLGWLDLPKAARAIAFNGSEAVYIAGDGFFEKLGSQLDSVYTIQLSSSASAIAVGKEGTVFVAQDSGLASTPRMVNCSTRSILVPARPSPALRSTTTA